MPSAARRNLVLATFYATVVKPLHLAYDKCSREHQTLRNWTSVWNGL